MSPIPRLGEGTLTVCWDVDKFSRMQPKILQLVPHPQIFYQEVTAIQVHPSFSLMYLRVTQHPSSGLESHQER